MAKTVGFNLELVLNDSFTMEFIGRIYNDIIYINSGLEFIKITSETKLNAM